MSDSAPVAASGAGEPAERTGAGKPARPEKRRGLFARIALFVRQVVAELKKVVRPTRSELVTYTTVVLVFVAVVMAFVTVVDLGIGQATRWIFGG
ncbi:MULTISPECIES: preprotein translocase subunit SecE [unclassified Cellulomonas]|uniref:preprotein translocase subunit SecE n=1 Tax=unclassified Cellulomonas TaxID=2620175 RepID=UPI00199DD401|nr:MULTISPECIES: preprotein translocase subunit SecE [unclassified Cellulomonas]MBD3779535.1 preprotein translocase subunit SecE [Micrococcales bacterium]QZN86038.1 preprotein translocase subunit SecE [Cellulomonas sp. C5510]WHP19129.1 preprotein translocase subunit SecE [Cellulomonas sp. ES6]